MAMASVAWAGGASSKANEPARASRMTRRGRPTRIFMRCPDSVPMQGGPRLLLPPESTRRENCYRWAMKKFRHGEAAGAVLGCERSPRPPFDLPVEDTLGAPKGVTDHDLLDRLKRGDEAAFDQLVEALH